MLKKKSNLKALAFALCATTVAGLYATPVFAIDASAAGSGTGAGAKYTVTVNGKEALTVATDKTTVLGDLILDNGTADPAAKLTVRAAIEANQNAITGLNGSVGTLNTTTDGLKADLYGAGSSAAPATGSIKAEVKDLRTLVGTKDDAANATSLVGQVKNLNENTKNITTTAEGTQVNGKLLAGSLQVANGNLVVADTGVVVGANGLTVNGTAKLTNGLEITGDITGTADIASKSIAVTGNMKADGDVAAANATFTGNVTAAEASFSGGLSAATGAFAVDGTTGDVSAANFNGTFNGDVYANYVYSADVETSNLYATNAGFNDGMGGADTVTIDGAAGTIAANAVTVAGQAVVTQDKLDAANSDLTAAKDRVSALEGKTVGISADGKEANFATSVTTGTLTAGNASFNVGGPNQVIITADGIKVGTGSAYINNDGFKVGTEGANSLTGANGLKATQATVSGDAKVNGKLTAGAAEVASLTASGAVNAESVTAGTAQINGNAVVTGNLTVGGKDLGSTITTLESKTQNIKTSTTLNETHFAGKLTAADGNFAVDKNGNILLQNGSNSVNIDSTGAIKTTGTIEGKGLSINNGVGEQLVVDSNGIQFVDDLKVGAKSAPVFTVNAATGDIDSRYNVTGASGQGTIKANNDGFAVTKANDNYASEMNLFNNQIQLEAKAKAVGGNFSKVTVDETNGVISNHNDATIKIEGDKDMTQISLNTANTTGKTAGLTLVENTGSALLNSSNETKVSGANSDLVVKENSAVLKSNDLNDASLQLLGDNVGDADKAILTGNNATLTLSKDTADLVAGTASVKTAAATGTTFANAAATGTTNINGATITLNDGAQETVITTNGNNGLKIGDKEVLLRGADGNLFSDPNTNLEINTQTGDVTVGTVADGKLTVGNAAGDKTVVTNGTATVDKSLTVGVTNKTVISEKSGYSEVLINEALANQTRIDKDGITVGTASTRIDANGVYVGAHDFASSKVGMQDTGAFRAADGRLAVAADGSLTIKTTATDVEPQFKVDATTGNTTVNGELHVTSDDTKATLDVINGEVKAVAGDAALTMNDTSTILANENSKISLDNSYATISVADDVKLTLNEADKDAKLVAENASLYMAKDTVNLVAGPNAKLNMDSAAGAVALEGTTSAAVKGAGSELNLEADSAVLNTDTDTKLALTADEATLAADADTNLTLDGDQDTAALVAGANAGLTMDSINKTANLKAGATDLAMTDTTAILTSATTTINGGNSSLTMTDDKVVLETAAGNANLTLTPDSATLTGGTAVIATTSAGSAFTNGANGQTLINGGTITLNNEGKAATILQANDKGGLQIVKDASNVYDVVMRDKDGNLVIGTEAADGFDGTNTDNNLLVNADKGMVTIKGSAAEDAAKFELQDKDGDIKFLVDKNGLTLRNKSGNDRFYVAAETGNITNNFEGGKLVTDAEGLKVETTTKNGTLTVTDATSEMTNGDSQVTLTDNKVVVNAGANAGLTLDKDAANANLKADNAELNLKNNEGKLTVAGEDKVIATDKNVTIQDGTSKVVVDDAKGATFENGDPNKTTNINGSAITSDNGTGSTVIDGNKITMNTNGGTETIIQANGTGGLTVQAGAGAPAYDVVLRDSNGDLHFNAGGDQNLQINTQTGEITVGASGGEQTNINKGDVKIDNSLVVGDEADKQTTIQDGNITTDQNLKVGGNAVIDGTLSAADNKFAVDADGAVKAADGKFAVDKDGAVKAADGKFAVDKDGAVKAADGKLTIDKDGALSAADGKFTVDAAGNTKVQGTLEVAENATFAKDTQTNGKATFGTAADNKTVIDGGSATVDKKVVVAGSTTIDKDVTIADPVNSGKQIELSELGQIDNVDVELQAEMQNNMGLTSDKFTAVDAVSAEAQIRRREIDRLDTKIESVGAMSAAIANLRTMGYDPAAPSEFSMSVGHYRGETAMAAGFFHYPHKDFMVSMSVSYGHDEVMGGVGATWKFGHRSPAEIARIERERQAEKAMKLAEAQAEAEEAERVAAQTARHQEMLAEQEALNAK